MCAFIFLKFGELLCVAIFFLLALDVILQMDVTKHHQQLFSFPGTFHLWLEEIQNSSYSSFIDELATCEVQQTFLFCCCRIQCFELWYIVQRMNFKICSENNIQKPSLLQFKYPGLRVSRLREFSHVYYKKQQQTTINSIPRLVDIIF